MSEHVNNIIKTQVTNGVTVRRAPPSITILPRAALPCERELGCTTDECHTKCNTGQERKCRPLTFNSAKNKYDGECVQCLANNHCVLPDALTCDKTSWTCGKGTSLAEYATVNLAATEVFKRMDATQDAIGGVQTNAASVAKVYGDTR